MKKEATTHAKAAKAIRADLKSAFPGAVFSVTSESFAGGNAVRVRYEDGPAYSLVMAVIERYQYGKFNGMSDSYDMNNVNESIPQVTFATISRTWSKDILIELMAAHGDNAWGKFQETSY